MLGLLTNMKVNKQKIATLTVKNLDKENKYA